MVRILMFISVLSLASCCKEDAGYCIEGYTGDDCTDLLDPLSLRITGITYFDIPQVDEQGQEWDTMHPWPDIYMKLEYLNGNIILETDISYNHMLANIHHSLVEFISEPIRITYIEWSENEIDREIVSAEIHLEDFNADKYFHEIDLGSRGLIKIGADSYS